METVVERPGALDVHKAQVTACVRVPAEHGSGREQHVVEFSTTVAGLLTLRDWLIAHGVTQVTMEATGVFWKPIWAILEDEFELLLVNARHVKQVPGRKTDVKDAEWLCQLAEAGLLKAELASWAGKCPGNDRSAGRRRSGRTRKGSKWLDWALEEAALAATRTSNVYLQAQYQRLRPRRGHKKALGAVKHSIICACWHMLSTGELYRDLGGDYFRKRDPERTTKRLVTQLEALGHRVTLEGVAA